MYILSRNDFFIKDILIRLNGCILLHDNYYFTTIWEKVSDIIIKKFNSELMYNKKYLRAKKRFNTKGSFQCFYIPVILNLKNLNIKNFFRLSVFRNIRKAFF